MSSNYYNTEELKRLPAIAKSILGYAKNAGVSHDAEKAIYRFFQKAIEENLCPRSQQGFSPLFHSLNTAQLLCSKVNADKSMALAALLSPLFGGHVVSLEEIRHLFGEDVAHLVANLQRVSELYEKSGKFKGNKSVTDKALSLEDKKRAEENDNNFRKMLLTFAEDLRVIIIMIVNWYNLMLSINHHPDTEFVEAVVKESANLYAPLAHRLGLYAIKSELEDMSLKYRDRETYSRIAHELNQTKAKRNAYITSFIEPVKKRLTEVGLKFEIKGRTKSISSIYNKILKQKTDLDHIYDLFAIRIILDSPREQEKSDCWRVFSEITNMYTANPQRTKDWLTIPKSNGYESLHTTVIGPDGKWVEVQIRSQRMDELAEKGVAAHFKYKGIKAEETLDNWMQNVRDIIEAADDNPMGQIKDIKIDVYDKEVFAFTPKGQVIKLPQGATILDFAFAIHTGLGCRCTGGRINGKNRKISHKLSNGDIVEVLSSPNQTPKLGWLNIVVSSKARNKIRAIIKEMDSKSAELGKELLTRRFKNRKIEVDESRLVRVIKRLGYKTNTEFYQAINDERLDPNDIITLYENLDAKNDAENRSADTFVMQNEVEEQSSSDNVLVIGSSDIKGLNYKLAKCCNPIYGDDVFGFISSEGIVKVHKTSCPNATHIRERYPYRIITTKWSGKIGSQFGATLRVVGNDDIGIVTNITSIINKENNVTLRNISIDSNDGLFQGYLVVGVSDKQTLNNLIKKIKTVKGVKGVERS